MPMTCRSIDDDRQSSIARPAPARIIIYAHIIGRDLAENFAPGDGHRERRP